MGYFQAENLKHKRTFTRKLVALAPFLTILMTVLAPLWFQANSFNWWYALLYPGFLTLICALVEQRDNGKLKYRAVFSLPVSLKNVWKGKIGVSFLYASIGNVIFLALHLLGALAFLSLYEMPLTISVLRAVEGTICIILASLWEVPLCLWLSKKFGIFLTVLLNAGVGSILGVFAATSSLWIVCPYSWVPHLMISVLGIMPNGELAAGQSAGDPFPMLLLTLVISLLLFAVFTRCTAKWFEKQEVKG